VVDAKQLRIDESWGVGRRRKGPKKVREEAPEID